MNVLKAADFPEEAFVSALWEWEDGRAFVETILTDVCPETNRDASLSVRRWSSRGLWNPVEQLVKNARKRRSETMRGRRSMRL